MTMVRWEALGKLKKINDFIGTRTRDFSACSIATQQCRFFLICSDEISTNITERFVSDCTSLTSLKGDPELRFLSRRQCYIEMSDATRIDNFNCSVFCFV
jgi:hypothetical protein